MVISKVLGMGISYKSNEAFVKPDDLDNFVIKGRKLVDKNYRNFIPLPVFVPYSKIYPSAAPAWKMDR